MSLGLGGSGVEDGLLEGVVEAMAGMGPGVGVPVLGSHFWGPPL